MPIQKQDIEDWKDDFQEFLGEVEDDLSTQGYRAFLLSSLRRITNELSRNSLNWAIPPETTKETRHE